MGKTIQIHSLNDPAYYFGVLYRSERAGFLSIGIGDCQCIYFTMCLVPTTFHLCITPHQVQLHGVCRPHRSDFLNLVSLPHHCPQLRLQPISMEVKGKNSLISMGVVWCFQQDFTASSALGSVCTCECRRENSPKFSLISLIYTTQSWSWCAM